MLRNCSMSGQVVNHFLNYKPISLPCLNAVNNTYFEKEGQGKKVYDWLIAHAAEYGFCQPYTAGRSSGYTEEKWHWTYLPLASQLTKAAAHQLTDDQVSGFLGDETAISIGVVEKYILGINPECY